MRRVEFQYPVSKIQYKLQNTSFRPYSSQFYGLKGKKVLGDKFEPKDLKSAIMGNITVQISFYYTQ